MLFIQTNSPYCVLGASFDQYSLFCIYEKITNSQILTELKNVGFNYDTKAVVIPYFLIKILYSSAQRLCCAGIFGIKYFMRTFNIIKKHCLSVHHVVLCCAESIAIK